MKNTKRIIATVLTAVMMISMLPSSVFAAELDAYDVVEPAVEAVSVPAEEQEIESTVEDISVEDAEEVQGSSEEIETVDAADPEAADVIEDTEAPVVGAENFPAQDFEGKTDSVTVKVHAPEGALPAGTELKVEEVKKEDVENLVGEGTEDFVAVDISFHVDGQEEDFEPLAAVEVEFVLEKDVLPQTENYDVIHVAVDEKGEETPEVIEEKNIIDEFTTEGGKISQKDFSVFIIAAAGETSASDVEPTDENQGQYAVETYKFFVGDEELVEFRQSVKKGDTLEEPAYEVAADEYLDGWFEGENEVTFGTVGDVVSGTEHTVEARIVKAFNVVFYDVDGIIIQTVKVKAGEAVDTTAVEAQSLDAQVFDGWTLTEGSTDRVPASYTVTQDTALYPVYVNGYTLSFDGNDDDGANSQATYTPSQYYTENQNTEAPADPERTGFSFGGWYNDEACTDPFSFGSPLSGNKTVYAKWNGDQTKYTIVFWQQSVNDHKNATTKTYDYYKSVQRNAVTGQTVYATAQDRNREDTEGFEGMRFARADGDKVVQADGTTVINVYYDRKLITYNFDVAITWYRRARGAEHPTHYWSWGLFGLGMGFYEKGTGPDPTATPRYVLMEDQTMQGLYGQSLSDYGYVWPAGEWHYQPNGTQLSFTDSFGYWYRKNTTTNFYSSIFASPEVLVLNYKQTADGQGYVLADEANVDAGNFTIAAKYDGFTPAHYAKGDYVEGETSLIGCAEESVVPTRQDDVLNIFHDRKLYELTFSKVDGTLLKDPENVRYGADLASYVPEDPEAPANYVFTGWYADKELNAPLDFSSMKMPKKSVVAYAGFKLVDHTVTLDPNGGTFVQDGSTSAKEITVTHGYELPAGTLDASAITRQGYELINWTKQNGTIWRSNEKVSEDGIVLTANWLYTAHIKIEYYKDGSLVAAGARDYRDGAEAEITRYVPEVADGEVFNGWTENSDGTGVVYHTGELYTVDGDKVVDGKIKLYAKCSHELVKTSVKFHANLENATVKRGEGAATTEYEWTDIPQNTEIDLSEVVAEATGYNLVGWAKTAKGEAVFEPSQVVAADKTGNDLYAVWEEQKFTVYHSGTREYKDYSIATDCVEGKFNIVGATDPNYLYGGYYEYIKNEGAVQKGTAYTESGLSMTPVAGTTYYLKEVDKRYLIPSVYRIYRKASPQVLRDMYLMTAVDNETTKVGFTIGGKDQSAAGRANEITIKKEGGRAATVIDSENTTICGIKGQTVAYLNLKDYVDDSKYEMNWDWGDQIVVTAFYVTEDEVKVTGAKNNTLTFGAEEALNQKWLTTTSMTSSKADVDPVYTDATALTLKASSARHTYMINASKALELAVTKVDNGKKVVQNVNEGNNTGKITYSGKAKYVFAGWYEDASYTKAADFSNVTKDMTVYAKYVKASDVKLSFAKKSVKGGKVTLKATLKINNQPNVTDAAVECNYNDKAYDVTFTGVKATKSGNATVNTFSGTVTIGSLANNDTFKAAISYTTPDGTLVSLKSKTCKYNAGLVIVK